MNTTPGKILLCVDGSSYTEVSCRYAAWIARRKNLSIDVLYVSDLWEYDMPLISDLSGSLGVQPYNGLIAQRQQLEKEKARFLEEAVRDRFKMLEAGLDVRFFHETGNLADTVREFEKNDPTINLVMLGKRGENASQATEHLGSTMERVVRSSTKPCLVTSRNYEAIQHVLLAYDGGPSVRKAVDWLCRNPGFGDIQLHLVTVNDQDDPDLALNRLQEAEKKLSAAGWKPACEMLTGVVEDAIAHYVETKKIHLLWMGAYGHSRIRHLLIGSTTTELIRRCRIPVALFR